MEQCLTVVSASDKKHSFKCDKEEQLQMWMHGLQEYVRQIKLHQQSPMSNNTQTKFKRPSFRRPNGRPSFAKLTAQRQACSIM